MPMIELSRFYPATPDETYRALALAAGELTKLRSYDDFSRSVVFTTRMTGWASGANVTAYAVPVEGGTMVRVEGQAKMRTQVNANNAAHKQVAAVLDEVSAVIQRRRAALA
jgi:hypothetical protein